MNSFTVIGTNDKIWNINQLINFLVTYQNKSINITINPEAIDLTQLGLYDILDSFAFESVTIDTYNLFETHDKYLINCSKNPWFFLKEKTNIDVSLHNWNQQKIFLTMYKRPTASRLGIASYLFNQYADQSHLHFSTGHTFDELEFFEMDKLLEYDMYSVVNVGKMIPNLPFELSSSKYYSPLGLMANTDNALLSKYQDIFVDIVGENHVKGDTFFPTEKTTRPMWLKKPFIAFASKNYLCYLRQMGFRTFSDFWDESYDGYEGKDRYLKILELIDSIAKKSKAELNDIYWSMKYTLDYNYDLLATQSYTTKITKI